MEEKFTGCKIIGTGHYVPDNILTNDDLTKMVDTSDEWISTRTGIKERHILSDDQTRTEMSVKAGFAALENAGLGVEDIDYLICSTVHGDFITPSLACCVQKDMGLKCPGFDINAACAGFLYALNIAASFIKSNSKINRVLVVSTEAMSRLVNWQDRNTCVLFGDGSGAAVVERSEENTFLASIEKAKGNSDVLYIDYNEQGKPCISMNGGEVFKFAVTSACRDIKSALKEAGLEQSDVKHVILHQANKRITDSVQGKLEISEDKYVSTIHKYGNTSSSGIAIALDELNRSGKINKGDVIAMSAFGGGLVSSAMIIRWDC